VTLTYRPFDFSRDSVEDLFTLATLVFGDAALYRKRWAWSYEQNPNRERYLILVAESEGRLVGATSRLPVKLRLGGSVVDGAFNANSMVHPEFRGRGIMERLYRMSAERVPVLCSKGPLPDMYRLLMKLGYRAMQPDTFVKSILMPRRWLEARLFKRQYHGAWVDHQPDGSGIESIARFPAAFDVLADRFCGSAGCAVRKDAAYLNWRYFANPVQSYRAFVGTSGGETVSFVVVSGREGLARIVDIGWDEHADGEPDRTIAFARRYLRRCGFTTVMCWATLPSLRRALGRQRFVPRDEVLRFSMYSAAHEPYLAEAASRLHFVDGDGDSEYLP